MLDELLSIALVGTGKGAGKPSGALPAPVESAAAQVNDAAAEQALLTRAILLNAYLQSGMKPSAVSAKPQPAEPDARPRCSDRAADLLADLLRENERELIAEWLALANAAGWRPPHRLIPDLLELARADKSLRQPTVGAIDHRGRWLIAQNADWQFATTQDGMDESLWETGTPEQRAAVLRAMRQSDPARARQWLQDTWKDDPADQRAEFLRQLATGLSPEDEPLLETALDDRSKQVRRVAADLLARLPQSPFVQRMVARAAPLLVFKRGLIKGAKFEVNLPAELDAAAQRDGIEKSPPQGTGEKQWWLQQIVSFVPPATWAGTTAGLTPADIIAAMAKTDFADALLKGLTAAAERHPDPQWLDSLLRHGFEASGILNRQLLASLAPRQFQGLALDVLRSKRVTLQACSDLIHNDAVRLDLPTAQLWVQTVASLGKRARREEWGVLWQLPTECATRLAPQVRDEIESRWPINAEPWVSFRGNIEKLLKTLDTRLQMHKELSA